jgi:hypothetical protein
MWAEHVTLSGISCTRLGALSCDGPPERQLVGHNTKCRHTRSSVPTSARPKPSHVRRSPHLAIVGDHRTLLGSQPSLRVLSLTPPAVAAHRNASLRAGTRTPSGSVVVLHTRRGAKQPGWTHRPTAPPDCSGVSPAPDSDTRHSPPRNDNQTSPGQLSVPLGSAPTFAENRSGPAEGDPDEKTFAWKWWKVAHFARDESACGGGKASGHVDLHSWYPRQQRELRAITTLKQALLGILMPTL